MSSITLAGVCMFLVLLANFDAANYGVDANQTLGVAAGSDRNNALGFLFLYIASFTFFLFITAMVVMSMFDKTKKHSKWVCLSAGALGLVFMLCSALLPLQSDSYALMREIRNGERNTHIQQYVQVQVIQAAMVQDTAGAPIIAMLMSEPMENWDNFLVTGLPNLLGMQGMSDADIKEAVDNLAVGMVSMREAIEENTPIAIQEAKDRAAYEYLHNTVIRVTSLLLYGSLPLVFGLKLMLEKKGENENGI